MSRNIYPFMATSCFCCTCMFWTRTSSPVLLSCRRPAKPVVIPAPVCEKAEIRQHVVVDGPDTVVVVAVPKQKLLRAHQVVRVATYTIYTVWEITHIKV